MFVLGLVIDNFRLCTPFTYCLLLEQYSTNTPGKGRNPIILPPAMGK